LNRPKTSAELGRERRSLEIDLEVRRQNTLNLMKAGCIITVGNDSWLGPAPEFRRPPPKGDYGEPGIGTIMSIESLVELGITPLQALVIATKNGAIACKGLKEFGTLEAGKLADLLLLDADPAANISNIRKIAVVMKEGRIIDRAKLPERPVFYRQGT
jgi:predicted amidohydrolase YtcJ